MEHILNGIYRAKREFCLQIMGNYILLTNFLCWTPWINDKMLILFEKKYVFIFQIEFMIILSPLWSANNLIHIANNAHTSALKQGEIIILSSLFHSRHKSIDSIRKQSTQYFILYDHWTKYIANYYSAQILTLECLPLPEVTIKFFYEISNFKEMSISYASNEYP